MRASGSHSVSSPASRCRAARCAAASSPATPRLHGAQPDRRPVPRVGVARASRRRRRRPPPPRWPSAASPTRASRMLVAENAIELGACRATLSRAATLVDAGDERARDAVRGDAGGEGVRQRGLGPDRRPRAGRARAAPATSTATRSRARTATSAPAASCTRSGPTAPTTSSAMSRSAAKSFCTEPTLDDRTASREAFGRFATGVAFVTADVGRHAARADRQLVRGGLARPAAGVVLPRAHVADLAADAGGAALRGPRPGHVARRVRPPRRGARSRPLRGAAWSDALAVIECDLEAEHPAGDHSIVVGRVRRLQLSAEPRPLVYFAGGFGAFNAH